MGPAAAPIMIAMTIAAAAASAVGQVQAAQARSNQEKAAQYQAEHQAELERYNMAIAEQEAADALRRGEIEADKQRTITALEIGNYRAAAAGRGVLVDQGSELDREKDIASAGEYDVATIKQNAKRESMKHTTDAVGMRASADIFKSQAKQHKSNSGTAITSGYIGATGTLLSGASKAAGQWSSVGKTT